MDTVFLVVQLRGAENAMKESDVEKCLHEVDEVVQLKLLVDELLSLMLMAMRSDVVLDPNIHSDVDVWMFLMHGRFFVRKFRLR